MTNPPLPEEIREQINKQAKIMYNSLYAQTAYKHAATTYASHALALKDALERIRDDRSLRNNPLEIRRVVDEALYKFPEQGKEVGL